MSGSSSEEEDVSKFQEAVDEKFTKAFANNAEGRKNSDDTSKEPLPSLRPTKDDHTFSCDYRSLNITPEFQKFVAKKLESSLERYLDQIECDTIDVKFSKKKRRKASSENGIKLFKTSNVLVKEFQDDIGHDGNKTSELHRKSRGNKQEVYNETEELEKAKAVAVDSTVILNGKETTAWSKDVKGEVIKVKRTSQDNEFSIEQPGYTSPKAWSGRVQRFIL